MILDGWIIDLCLVFNVNKISFNCEGSGLFIDGNLSPSGGEKDK